MWKKFLRYLNLFIVQSRAQLRSSDYHSFMGALWSIMGPILTFAVLYFIFVERFGAHISQFPAKLFASVILLTFFHRLISATMVSLSYSQSIIHDSLTPSECLLLSGLTVPIIKYAVEMTLCVLVTSCFILHQAPCLHRLVSISVTFVFMAVGLGLLIGTLNALASDAGEIWGNLSPLFMFISPIFYSMDMLSPWARTLVLWLNPMTPFLLWLQSTIANKPVPYFSPYTFLQAGGTGLFFFITGYFFFKKFEKQMAENV